MSRRNATQATRQLQRQHCQALLHVHLLHPLLLTQGHPAGLSLIKTMLGEAHSHLEGDCSLLLPDCWDWLHYRIILQNCFFYKSNTCSSPFSLGCSWPCCPEVRKRNRPKHQNPTMALLSKVKKGSCPFICGKWPGIESISHVTMKKMEDSNEMA